MSGSSGGGGGGGSSSSSSSAAAHAASVRREHDSVLEQLYARCAAAEREAEALRQWRDVAAEYEKERLRAREAAAQLARDRDEALGQVRALKRLLQSLSVHGWVHDFRLRKSLGSLYARVARTVAAVSEEEARGSPARREEWRNGDSDFVPGMPMPAQSELDSWIVRGDLLRLSRRSDVRCVLQHLEDLDASLAAALRGIQEQKRHWKALADRLFERNTELVVQRAAVEQRVADKDAELAAARAESEAARRETETLRAREAELRAALAQARRRERAGEEERAALSKRLLAVCAERDLRARASASPPRRNAQQGERVDAPPSAPPSPPPPQAASALDKELDAFARGLGRNAAECKGCARCALAAETAKTASASPVASPPSASAASPTSPPVRPDSSLSAARSRPSSARAAPRLSELRVLERHLGLRLQRPSPRRFAPLELPGEAIEPPAIVARELEAARTMRTAR
jgi:hypothetical protein